MDTATAYVVPPNAAGVPRRRARRVARRSVPGVVHVAVREALASTWDDIGAAQRVLESVGNDLALLERARASLRAVSGVGRPTPVRARALATLERAIEAALTCDGTQESSGGSGAGGVGRGE